MSDESQTRFALSVRIGDRPALIDADQAMAVVPAPEVARVPGSPSALDGVAWYEGEPIPIVRIGREPGPVIVCMTRSFGRVGLAGLAVDGTARVRADDPHANWLDAGALVENALGASPAAPWRA